MSSVSTTAVASKDVTGSTWQYTQGQGTSPQTSVVAAFSGTNAGLVPATRIVYPQPPVPTNGTITTGIAIQIGVQALAPSAPRIIAKAKTALLPADTRPYLMTGRFKFNSTDLWIWQDALNKGSWSDIKLMGDWATVRGASAAAGTDYIRLFVSIMDPGGNIYYIQPVQVITITAPQMNTWIDFSFYFTTPVDIPATAEIRFLHGTNTREFGVEWWFDEIGITPPSDTENNLHLYWFDGDSKVPANAEDYMLPEGIWDPLSTDSYMAWTGTVGNSTSVWYGPSIVTTTTTCQLEVPTGNYCDPVFINDPVSPQRNQWFSLIGIGDLDYAARQTLHNIINRAPVTAVSQVRQWASGTLTLMTRTLAERSMALQVFESGQIVFYRNPDPAYPESSWYLAIGNAKESRLGPDHRRPERLWDIPFARVERPSGLIDVQTGRIWQTIKDENANWMATRTKNDDWLGVLTGRSGTV
jgi:hypothetical protein